MRKMQKHPENLLVIGPMKFPKKALKDLYDITKTGLIFVDGGTIHFELLKKMYPELTKDSQTIGDGDSSKR